MLVVWNGWLSGYRHIFGHFHFLFWGCGMQDSLYPSKDEEIDKFGSGICVLSCTRVGGVEHV